MQKAEEGPSLGQDLAALSNLYLTFLWMLRQRLYYGSRWQYHHRWSPLRSNGAAHEPAPTAHR